MSNRISANGSLNVDYHESSSSRQSRINSSTSKSVGNDKRYRKPSRKSAASKLQRLQHCSESSEDEADPIISSVTKDMPSSLISPGLHQLVLAASSSVEASG